MMLLIACLVPEAAGADGGGAREAAFAAELCGRAAPAEAHELGVPVVAEACLGVPARELDAGRYDAGRLARAEAEVRGLDPALALRELFGRITAGVAAGDHEGRWLAAHAWLTGAIRHPPLMQPTHGDGAMVTHPLLLLALGEGRCGQAARLVVDLALACGYEARLAQLAAHQVAEVRWDGRWHWIDADLDFPAADLRAAFPGGLPDVAGLSRDPRALAALPARARRRERSRDARSLDGYVHPSAVWFPAEPTVPSVYFAAPLFANRHAPERPRPRDGVEYWSKRGGPAAWLDDRLYGWGDCSMCTGEVATLPLEYEPERVELAAPAVVRVASGRAVVPVVFLAASRVAPVGDDPFAVRGVEEAVEHEIRVSSRSRGWDYGYRNYRRMPGRGVGDLLVLKRAVPPGGERFVRVALDLGDRSGEIYIEVIPRFEPAPLETGFFRWPSPEAQVRILRGERFTREGDPPQPRSNVREGR